MHNVFCFNGFNQTVIVLRYSAHIKPRKTIKTTETKKYPKTQYEEDIILCLPQKVHNPSLTEVSTPADECQWVSPVC